MDYSTQDYYFQVVSGYVDHLYEDIEESTPAPPHISNPIENELRETLSIPVPKVTDQDHHRYLNPLKLDALLAAAVSDPVRRYEFSKALHIWQHYHDTDCSEDLKAVLQMVWKCYTDLADKYGLSDVMQLDGGSAQEPAESVAAAITEEPAGSVAAAVEGPRHDVPADWPEMLRTDKAIKLAYELEKLGYLNEDWQPGPKLYKKSSGDFNAAKASYVTQQFREYLKKGQSYTPEFIRYWNRAVPRRSSLTKSIDEVEKIRRELNR